MSFPAQFRTSLGFVKRILKYRSLTTASLIQLNLANIAVPMHPEGRRIACEGLGFSFDPRTQPFYLHHMIVARDLVLGGHGTFRVNEAGWPEFRTGSLSFVPEVRDDLLVLDEVFVRQIYNFYPNRDCFVLDIGMNIGVVSLFFAAIKGWDVLGFEPFPETFAAATRSIERNGMKGRIQTRMAAVAANSGEMEIAYHLEGRATNGLFGNLHEGRSGPDVRTTIRLVGAIEALDEAIELAAGRPIFAKIDCEGAEYEILDRLVEAGRLKDIAVLVVEYHRILPEHRPERLIEHFRTHGFVVQHMWGSAEAGGLFAIQGAV